MSVRNDHNRPAEIAEGHGFTELADIFGGYLCECGESWTVYHEREVTLPPASTPGLYHDGLPFHPMMSHPDDDPNDPARRLICRYCGLRSSEIGDWGCKEAPMPPASTDGGDRG